QALHEAERGAEQEGQGDHEGGTHAVAVEQRRREHGGERDHRAHREVDSAGEDDEGHADGGDGQERIVDEEVQEDLEREEAVEEERARAEHQDEQRQGDRQGQQTRVHPEPSASGQRQGGGGRLGARGRGGGGVEVVHGAASPIWPSAAMRFRIRSDCRMLTTKTTSAFTTRVTSGGTPTEQMVVVSVWVMRARTTLPRGVKRPPESDVPPRTTARMASSSRSRPALFPSALFTLELTIRPAIPAQRPQTAYTQKVME